MADMSPKDFNDRMNIDFENCIRIKRPDLWKRCQAGEDIVVAKITYLEPLDFEVSK